MANMFSQKCDICGIVQTEEDHLKIKGTSVVMNGVAKFACGECRDLMHTAFSVGTEGLREPLLALAKVTKERDEFRRLLEQSKIQREAGTVSLVGVELDHRSAQAWNQLAPERRLELGRPMPVVGGIGHMPNAHRLEQKPADPKPEKKSLMDKLGFKGKKKK
jgi:hypothetical protein